MAKINSSFHNSEDGSKWICGPHDDVCISCKEKRAGLLFGVKKLNGDTGVCFICWECLDMSAPESK